MRRNIIELNGALAREEARRFAAPLNFSMCEGEHIALMGLNGSGKSTLIDTILGKIFLKEGAVHYDFGAGDDSAYRNIRHITFRDAYGSADGGYYYQQRWNSSDREETPSVSELLGSIQDGDETQQRLFDLLGIASMLHKKIVTLSSGELRRFHLAKALSGLPKVLILEDPFIGLDVRTRSLLSDLLEQMAHDSGLQLILAVSLPDEIPSFITHVYTLVDMRCGEKQALGEFRRTEKFTALRTSLRNDSTCAVELPPQLTIPGQSKDVAVLNNIRICYGTRTLFGGLDWNVARGEKWTLTGVNGSGKSTLLSLITADNPQAYSQDITLFGRRRGTGESIWDIKRHIGYVSPEMHRSYMKNIPALEIVASGFFDSIGLYHTASDDQREVCRQWLRCLGAEHLAGRSFLKLSSGEQRLVLLARAFVKDPDLLILDEPLHGLDCCKKELARTVIDSFCGREGKTMIYVTHYENEVPGCVAKRLELSVS